MLEMIQQGYLCPVVPKQTETQLDVGGVGTRGGEFIAKDLEAAVDRDEVTRAAVPRSSSTARAAAPGWCSAPASPMRATSATPSASTASPPRPSPATRPAPERDGILAAFKAGRLRCVTNANVLTTGFDAPGTDLIALLRPTKSVGLYVQMVGRGTRLAEGKDDCLVLDFAGNTARHGPIDTVDGRKKEPAGDGEAPIKVCPECQTINHASVRHCIECDYEFPPPEVKVAAQAASNALLSIQDAGGLVRRHWHPLRAPREARQAGLAARHLRMRPRARTASGSASSTPAFRATRPAPGGGGARRICRRRTRWTRRWRRPARCASRSRSRCGRPASTPRSSRRGSCEMRSLSSPRRPRLGTGSHPRTLRVH